MTPTESLLHLAALYTVLSTIIGLTRWAKAPTGRIDVRRLIVNAILWPLLIRGRLL